MIDELKSKLRDEGINLSVQEVDGKFNVTLTNTLNSDRIGYASSVKSQEDAILKVIAICLGNYSSMKSTSFTQSECFINVDVDKVFKWFYSNS